mgnify:FL=1
MRTITITGSEGLLGSELCNFFEKTDNVKKLDLALGHDLADESFVKKWFKDNPTTYLINCFAMNDHGNSKTTLFDFSLDYFNDYLKINLTSLFSVCREFARNNNNGAIVNFSSIYGMVSPRPTLYDGAHKDIGYCVSKEGVINMTKYLAIHLAPNLRVNCVVPGGVGNDVKTLSNIDNEYSKLTPMKRMMKKYELNGIIDFLCSEKSSYVTGSSYVVDGGFTSW